MPDHILRVETVRPEDGASTMQPSPFAPDSPLTPS